MKLTIGGVGQWISIRGHDTSNPVLLIRCSAHFPLFEEPASFALALKAVRDAREG